MASEMVERVARVIDPDAFDPCPHKTGGLCLLCAEAQDNAWYLARAAIEALREPTEAMADDGDHHCSASDVRHVWQAMIDQALK